MEFTSAEVAAAMTRSFQHYFVPMVFDAAAFERRFRGEHLDPAASRLWFQGDELVGVVFIARRGWQSRVAAMGLVPEYRSQGLGKIMLGTALKEAQQRGDQSMLLEVFTENVPAIRLYERLGFRRTRRLLGFRQEAGAAPNTGEMLTEMDPLELARVVIRETEEPLPWMSSGETLLSITKPTKAFRLQEQAYALIRPDANGQFVQMLLVPRAYRRQGWGTRLVRALEARFPDYPTIVPCLVPEGPGTDFMRACGWAQTDLALYEMVCLLA
ncbi:GNAT family N-acetyltransferase [Hymenobacter taeanensis]|uniref:GNAT family N-acetyltransferase n=1 Tax=Hymenobacter taeanensis TaxID=2735321 RepID=A0A6M6BK35_9BACT|nr:MULTISPECIES: GNAT family N-acetyltransferase [Hymenobacter]QJX48456.1 GNAT family N-acetyltransferase [Hymenobacter taeanensis]UOQ82052.1 GNAT family N-acetyltransferase [Hymenobacter sp. 5414T-23]